MRLHVKTAALAVALTVFGTSGAFTTPAAHATAFGNVAIEAAAATAAATTGGIPANSEVHTRTLEVFPDSPQRILPARGLGMQREPLDLAVATGSVVEARVTNGAGAVQLEIVGDDADQDRKVSVPKSGAWVTVTAANAGGLFARLNDEISWPTAPILEYRVIGGTQFDMPVYKLNGDQAAFMQNWDDSASPLAVIQDQAIVIAIPAGDKEKMRNLSWSEYKNFDEIILGLRGIINKFDTWLGVETVKPAQAHMQRPHRYFMRADKTGPGLAYYHQGVTVAFSSGSVAGYLLGTNAWVTLHELGHGYDGYMTSQATGDDMALGEVWNNMYASFYQIYVNNRPQWIYGGGSKAATRERLDAKVTAATPARFNQDFGYGDKLDFLHRIVDATGGIQGFTDYNKRVRELQLFNPGILNSKRTDLVLRYWGHPNNMNLLPYFDSLSLPASDSMRQYLMNIAPTTMAQPLSRYYRDAEKLAAAITQLGLGTAGDLVTTTAMKALGQTKPTTVTADIADVSAVEGRTVTLWDGTTKVAQAAFVNGVADFGDIALGAYTVRYPEARTTGAVPVEAVLNVADFGADSTVKYDAAASAVTLGSVNLNALGLGDRLISRVAYLHGTKKLKVSDTLYEPHSYFGAEEYIHVSVKNPAGESIFERSFIGNKANTAPSGFDVDAPIGTTITIMHREPGRLTGESAYSNTKLKTLNASATTTSYQVTEFGLVRLVAGEPANPDLATQASVTELRALADALQADVEANPEADFSARAAKLRMDMRSLPQAEADVLLQDYAPLFEKALAPAVSDPTPEPTPTVEPTPEPTPTVTPTVEPTPEPTTPAPTPTVEPSTPAPTPEPTTPAPTPEPTTPAPTPTVEPTTPAPTPEPTTPAPTPTVEPSTPAPTPEPTTPAPTPEPTTPAPTPTVEPTTPAPTPEPSTPAPTTAPTTAPTVAPTPKPTPTRPTKPAPKLVVFKNPTSDKLFKLVGTGSALRAVHISFTEWAAAGFPAPVNMPVAYVKYAWSDDIFAVSFWGTDRATWTWQKLTFADWRSVGFPKFNVAGWILGTSVHKYATSDELFATLNGKTHKMSFAEWRDMGFPGFETRNDQGFLKAPNRFEVYKMTSLSQNRGQRVSFGEWAAAGYPTPLLSSVTPR